MTDDIKTKLIKFIEDNEIHDDEKEYILKIGKEKYDRLSEEHKKDFTDKLDKLAKIDEKLKANTDMDDMKLALYEFQKEALIYYIKNHFESGSPSDELNKLFKEKWEDVEEVVTEEPALIIPNTTLLGNNPEETAKKLFIWLETYIKNNNNLFPKITEHSGNTFMNRLAYLIDDIIKWYNIFNTPPLLYIFGLLSEKTIFDTTFKSLQIKEKNVEMSKESFINLFFVNITTFTIYEKIVKDDTNFSPRDTFIYFLHNESSDQEYIFIHTLLVQLGNVFHNSDLREPLLRDETLTKQLYNLFIIFFATLKIIIENYKVLFNGMDITKTAYNELIKSKKKIHIYIKERCDKEKKENVLNRNPRFNIKYKSDTLMHSKISESDEGDDKKYSGSGYLYLNYKNLDGKYDLNTNYVATNAVRYNANEYYYFGEFDGYFDPDYTPKLIADKLSSEILAKLKVKDNTYCIIGYGQSGSGKTSTLIYTNYKIGTTIEKYDGVISEICNTTDFTSFFNKIKVTIKNIYIRHNKNINNMNDIKEEDYNLEQLPNNLENIFLFKDTKWKKDTKELGDFINDAFNKRQIRPTPNNIESSRSHIIVCMELFNKSNQSQSQSHSKLIICDLAGVENEFECDKLGEIFKFDNAYIRAYDKDNNITLKQDTYLCDDIKTDTSGMITPDGIYDYNTIAENIEQFFLHRSYEASLTGGAKRGVRTGIRKGASNSAPIPKSTSRSDMNIKFQKNIIDTQKIIFNFVDIIDTEEKLNNLKNNLNTIKIDETKIKDVITPIIYFLQRLPPEKTTDKFEVVPDIRPEFLLPESINTNVSQIDKYINSILKMQRKGPIFLTTSHEIIRFSYKELLTMKPKLIIINKKLNLTLHTHSDEFIIIKFKLECYIKIIQKIIDIYSISESNVLPEPGTDLEIKRGKVPGPVTRLATGQGILPGTGRGRGTEPVAVQAPGPGTRPGTRPGQGIGPVAVQAPVTEPKLEPKPVTEPVTEPVTKTVAVPVAVPVPVTEQVAVPVAVPVADSGSVLDQATSIYNVEDEVEEDDAIDTEKSDMSTKCTIDKSFSIYTDCNLKNNSKDKKKCNEGIKKLEQCAEKLIYTKNFNNILDLESYLKQIMIEMNHLINHINNIATLNTWLDEKQSLATIMQKYIDEKPTALATQRNIKFIEIYNQPFFNNQDLYNIINVCKILNFILKNNTELLSDVNTEISELKDYIEIKKDSEKTYPEFIKKIDNDIYFMIVISLIKKFPPWFFHITKNYRELAPNDLNFIINEDSTTNFKCINTDIFENYQFKVTASSHKLFIFGLTLGNKLKDKFKGELIKELHKYECEYIRIKTLVHNCKLRKTEGYMINRTLKDMGDDIRNIIKNTLKLENTNNKLYLPIFLDNNISQYCSSSNYDDKYFDDFYSIKKNTKTSGKIMDIIKNFGVNFSKMYFCIFTVINTSSNETTNNPPIPPYININKLIYFKQINYNIYNITNELRVLFVKLKKYEFYEEDYIIKYYSDVFNSPLINNGQINEIVDKLIIIIKRNNATTLIGSLETTDEFQHLSYNKLTCSHSDNLLDPNIYDNFKIKNLIEHYKLPDIEHDLSTDINKTVKENKVDFDKIISLCANFNDTFNIYHTDIHNNTLDKIKLYDAYFLFNRSALYSNTGVQFTTIEHNLSFNKDGIDNILKKINNKKKELIKKYNEQKKVFDTEINIICTNRHLSNEDSKTLNMLIDEYMLYKNNIIDKYEEIKNKIADIIRKYLIKSSIDNVLFYNKSKVKRFTLDKIINKIYNHYVEIINILNKKNIDKVTSEIITMLCSPSCDINSDITS